MQIFASDTSSNLFRVGQTSRSFTPKANKGTQKLCFYSTPIEFIWIYHFGRGMANESGTRAEMPTFSAALEAAIRDVVPDGDALDAPMFDPVAYMNAQFPDEGALVGPMVGAVPASASEEVSRLVG